MRALLKKNKMALIVTMQEQKNLRQKHGNYAHAKKSKLFL